MTRSCASDLEITSRIQALKHLGRPLLGGRNGVARAGVVGGLVVGQAFNGTIIPLAAGYLSFGLLALAAVLWTEEGRLFAPHHPDPIAAPVPAE